MTRFARCLLAASGFTLLSSLLPAHSQEDKSPAPGAVATLHTGTKLVVVDVVVRDKSGHAVHGLTRDDFLLSEGREPQNVRSFDEYSAPAVPAAFPAMPTLPPGLFTNFTPVPAHGPLNVLLIDGINTQIADQQYLRLQLLDYTAHLAPGTRIAIFGLAPGHVYMLQGFTGDPAALHSVLASTFAHKSLLLANGSTNQEALTDALTDPSGGPSAGATIPMSAGGSALMTSAAQTFLQQVGVSEAAAARYFTLAEARNGHRTGSIQATVFLCDTNGKLLNTASRTVTLNLTPAAPQSSKSQSLQPR